MLDHMGEAKRITWLTVEVPIFAAKPSGNDRAQVRKVYGGACDIAIGNTYYMGKMQTNEKKLEQKDWARSVRLIFLDMPNGGAHMNVSGMAMAKHAPNRAHAQKLMEFLVLPEAQEIYAEVNFEYPIRQDVAASNRVESCDLRLTSCRLTVSPRSATASELVDEVFNDGP